MIKKINNKSDKESLKMLKEKLEYLEKDYDDLNKEFMRYYR